MEGRKHKEIDSEVEILLCFSKGAKTRRKILKSLQYRPKNCHQIAKELNLDWSSVQKHLRHLKKANLVKGLKLEELSFTGRLLASIEKRRIWFYQCERNP